MVKQASSEIKKITPISEPNHLNGLFSLKIHQTNCRLRFLVQIKLIQLELKFKLKFPTNNEKTPFAKKSPLLHFYANRFNLFDKWDEGYLNRHFAGRRVILLSNSFSYFPLHCSKLHWHECHL